jgi:hypothetical protein
MAILNLTGRRVFLQPNGATSHTEYPPTGVVASVEDNVLNVTVGGAHKIVGGVPVVTEPSAEAPIRVVGLPDPAGDTQYLVNRAVLSALVRLGVARSDVFAPDADKNGVAVTDPSTGVVVGFVVTRLYGMQT